MKVTLCITQRCTLSCRYCYVGKRTGTMSLQTAQQVVDWAFRYTPQDEDVEFGLAAPFGDFGRHLVASLKVKIPPSADAEVRRNTGHDTGRGS